MAKIIGISGRKQAGKNTLANIITGSILLQKGMISDFSVDENGNLIIQTVDNNNKSGWGILDLLRTDDTFVNYAENDLWPHVKIYHFADVLKNICTNLFNIDQKIVYGTDRLKNTKININWEDMPDNTENKKGRMTAREFMQHFGTNVIRKIKDDVWVDVTIRRIFQEDPEVAIIPDVRFPNEVEAIHDNGGIVIRLSRNVFNDPHKCESLLDKSTFDWNQFDLVIDNDGISLTDLVNIANQNTKLWEIK